jgi:hypothetical protein
MSAWVALLGSVMLVLPLIQFAGTTMSSEIFYDDFSVAFAKMKMPPGDEKLSFLRVYYE